MNELISVIIPIYKVEKYLNRCLESVVNQTYKKLEIILVDDGSPDGCPQICDEYAQKDSRIIVIHKENGGQSTARNAGLDICKGEYIAFVDSDDYVSEKYIESLYNSLTENGTDIAICGTQEVDEKGNFKKNKTYKLHKEIKYNQEECLDWLYFKEDGTILVPWNKLYKKFIWKDLRFPVGLLFEDSYIIIDILNIINGISIEKENLYYYRIRKGSTTNSGITTKKLKSYIEVYKHRFICGSNSMKYFKVSLIKFLDTCMCCYKKIRENDLKQQVKSEFVTNYQQYKNCKMSLKRRIKYNLFIYCPILLKILRRI